MPASEAAGLLLQFHSVIANHGASDNKLRFYRVITIPLLLPSIGRLLHIKPQLAWITLL
ncbi:MAG: hypothetical protein ACI8UP_003889 [Porticoccaceae bacterium]|jgi:hypothetical protein